MFGLNHGDIALLRNERTDILRGAARGYRKIRIAADEIASLNAFEVGELFAVYLNVVFRTVLADINRYIETIVLERLFESCVGKERAQFARKHILHFTEILGFFNGFRLQQNFRDRKVGTASFKRF